MKDAQAALDRALETYVAGSSRDTSIGPGPPQSLDRVDSTDAFRALVAQIDALTKPSHTGSIYAFLGTPVPMDSEGLAWWSLRRASRTNTVTACLDIDRFLSEPSYRYHVVLVLADAQVNEGFELAEGIRLIPYSEVPSTGQKDACDLEAASRRNFALHGQPTAALISWHDHPTTEIDPGSTSSARRAQREPALKAANNLYEAKCCLALVAETSPFEIAQWMAPDPNVPLTLRSAPRGLYPGPLYSRPVDCDKPRDELRRLHSDVSDLEPKARDSLRITLHYLDMALGATSMIDATVYLGIGLESLFLDDQSHGELKFRLRVRAAKLLGQNEEERNAIFTLSGKFYDYRSAAVHRGRLIPPKDKSQLEWSTAFRDDVFSPIVDLLKRGILRKIESGTIDWDAVLLS